MSSSLLPYSLSLLFPSFISCLYPSFFLTLLLSLSIASYTGLCRSGLLVSGSPYPSLLVSLPSLFFVVLISDSYFSLLSLLPHRIPSSLSSSHPGLCRSQLLIFTSNPSLLVSFLPSLFFVSLISRFHFFTLSLLPHLISFSPSLLIQDCIGVGFSLPFFLILLYFSPSFLSYSSTLLFPSSTLSIYLFFLTLFPPALCLLIFTQYQKLKCDSSLSLSFSSFLPSACFPLLSYLYISPFLRFLSRPSLLSSFLFLPVFVFFI